MQTQVEELKFDVKVSLRFKDKYAKITEVILNV